MRFKDYAKKRDCSYETFARQVKTICASRGHALKVMGKNSNGEEIYRVEINPTGKKTVAFVAGIHGNEKAGPYAVINFLRRPQPSKFRILLYPCVNPHGYEQHIRRNADQRDLNRDWCDGPTMGETKALKSLENEGVVFLHTLHEDPNNNGFYIYYSDIEHKSLYTKLIDMGKSYLPMKDDETVWGDKLVNGMVPDHVLSKERAKHRCCFETWMHNQGVNYLTTETPGKALMMKRVGFHRRAMDMVLTSLALVAKTG